ncbi:MAG: Holliday junction branch migration protein RuvA [Bacteroidales bacterium]|jgi:Holliday junction DNA helicase RuvA|nr:Holliday junction branch migration protein RuvA [Bacteroidales bacterium]
MYDYIKGKLAELTPTQAIIENSGIGWKLEISLQTYSGIQGRDEIKLFVYHHLREDAELLYGFFDKKEREMFEKLIGVSGIGPNTARVILSSLTIDELTSAVLNGDVSKIKSIKGIGLKTAQRLIIDIKDSIGKSGKNELPLQPQNNDIHDETLSALTLLGFPKSSAEKVISKNLKEHPSSSLEELIKLCLKSL